MPTQTKNTRNIFKGDNSILQKKPKFCDISYGINKKKRPNKFESSLKKYRRFKPLF